MQTPAGTECPYYFEDFFRGRNKQTCRLIERTPKGGKWSPDLCANCRTPRIVLANACPNLLLQAHVRSTLFGFKKHVEVTATGKLTLEPVEEPEIGCGRCHLEFPTFSVAGDET
jgi:hypothetical protein